MSNTNIWDYPEPPTKSNPICPLCGCECYTIFLRFGEVIGCDECVDNEDAYEWMKEQEEEQRERCEEWREDR